MKNSIKISLLLFCFAMPICANAQRPLPITDTIGRIERLLKDYIKKIESLDENIQNYDDINKYNINENIKETKEDCDSYYRSNQDIIEAYDNLKLLVEQFRFRQRNLEVRISKIQQEHFQNELQSKLNNSLNEMQNDWELVQQYVQAKRGKTDSLSNVQRHCQTRYDKTYQLLNSYDFQIANNEEIKSTLDSISALNERIQAAQIKEVKIGDILFKVALIVAALTTTIALISSRIRSAKLLKQNLQDYNQGKKNKKHKNSDAIEL